MATRKATMDEVRGLYEDQGHTVRIDQDGHVEFKRDGKGSWLEGRWISEYRVDDEVGVILI